jgi:hypothetical protein
LGPHRYATLEVVPGRIDPLNGCSIYRRTTNIGTAQPADPDQQQPDSNTENQYTTCHSCDRTLTHQGNAGRADESRGESQHTALSSSTHGRAFLAA